MSRVEAAVREPQQRISPQYARARIGRMTSRGCLRVLTRKLMGLGRNGDVDGFREYIRSDDFLEAFNGLDPEHRQAVLSCHRKAEIVLEQKARHPLVKPRRIDARRADKADWSDPLMLARLAEAYAVAGDDHQMAARILGVTEGSARQARKRYLAW